MVFPEYQSATMFVLMTFVYCPLEKVVLKLEILYTLQFFASLMGEGKISIEDFSGISSKVSVYSSNDDLYPVNSCQIQWFQLNILM